jgi:hypothetical protein
LRADEEAFRERGATLPDRIAIYVAGAVAVDANLRFADLTPSDESSLTPEPEMTGNGQVVQLERPIRLPLVARGAATGSNAAVIQTVIVHAQLDGNGKVSEQELSAASDPALAQRALDLVKGMKFAHGGVQRQAYISVRFVPAPQ